MRKEATKKSKLWLWLVIGLVALVAIAGVVVALVLGGGSKEETGPKGGRPDLYWNLDKATYTQDSQSGLSTREPGEDGVYRIRFAYNGQQVELPITDKRLVNYIDTMDVMGIVQDADGVVVDVVDPEEIATPIAQNAYVQQVMSDRIIANSSIAMNGMQYVIELADLTELYNVSDTAKEPGEHIDVNEFMAMDSVWVYANDLEEITHVFLTGHSVTSPVYWRAYQMWNSAEKSTSRVPDENGVYSIDFCSDGGIVTLKCKDKAIVTSIDNKSPHSCHFGFVFDEEGYIVEIMNSGIGIRGAVAAERIEITELDGNTFSGTQLIPSDGGLSYSATLPESCVIYDASSSAAREGRQGQPVDSLKLGDRVCVWTDPTGTPVQVYIANRLVDVPAYFNLVRNYDNTKKETTRKPDGAGYYVFEVIETGKEGKLTVKTKDKALATFIDAIANRIVGLKIVNGIIENAYVDDDVFGWTSIYGGYVPQIQGAIVSLVSFSKPDSPSNVLMGANYKAYDVSGKDVPYGSETTLRVGDIATVTRDVSANGVTIYITRRMVGGEHVYYNLDYQYNSKTQETNRKPDENGWYTFTMAHNGKQVEVKTKSKDLATKIDKSPSGDLVDVMRVEGGVAYELYDTAAAYGQSLNSGWRVSAINGDGTYNVMAANGNEKVLKMAEDCVIYNVSTVFDSHRGERIYNLRIGDMVTSLADYKSNVKMILVRFRAVDKMYANKYPMYDYSKKETMRKPDAQGWYWFDLSEEGEMKRFKTNDKALATAIDAYTTPFGLRVEGDLIRNVVAPTWVRGVYKAGINGWDVVSVSGGNAKIKLNKPGYTDTGKTKSIYAGSGVKVYDISPTAERFGMPVKLQEGDRIRTYLDRFDNCVYVFVLHHATRVKGTVGYCEHCQQDVFWNPWAGESWDGIDCHYYLSGSTEITKQTSIGNDTKEYEVVLDMNGNKLTVNGARAILAYKGDNLSLLDSVGGGEIKATGVEGGNGGTIMISGGSTMNLYSGILSFVDSDVHVFKGGVLFVGPESTLNIYNGTIKGGVVNSPEKNVQGGNIYVQGGTINMYGGVIEDGRAERTTGLEPAVAAQGGNIYGIRNGVLNLYGGEIRNGYSNQHGGNLFLSTCTLNMSGGTITGGECLYSGANMYSQFATVLNISGGVVDNGKAGAAGNNLYAAHDSNELNISGGTITGDMTIAASKYVSVSGTAKVTVGEKSGLAIPSTVKMVVDGLSSGAEVCVNAKGAFTVANKKAQDYVDAGYIKPAAIRTVIEVIDDVMYMEGEEAYCEHCNQIVPWYEWPGKSSPESGHYFIAKDYKQTAQLTIAADTDVVLDLYGKKYTSEEIRNFLVRGTLSIMDSVGGGEMITTGGAEFAGAIALVGTASGSEKPAGFNLYSGTLRLAEDHPEFANGGLVMFSGGTMNIYGGTMIGGHVLQRGGCINVNSSASTLNIYGGVIKGGTAGISGGCIDISGTLNIEGGTVEGEIFVEPSSKGVTVAGDVKIGCLDLTSGIRADISGLTEGADIGVKAIGTFTKPLENPVAYLPLVHLVDTEGTLQASSGGLSVALSDDYIANKNAIYSQAVQMTTDGTFTAGTTIFAVCPVCEIEVEWLDMNALEEKKITEHAHFYLSDDLNTESLYSLNANVCLHLNGHNFTSTARAIYVESGYHLNIMGDGVVSGAGQKHSSLGWWGVLDVPGSADLYGGTYYATSNGPAIAVRGNNAKSIVNIYEGTRVVRTDGQGIGIRLYDDGDVKMFGGVVSGAANNFVLESSSTVTRSVELSIFGGTIETTATGEGSNIHASGASTSVNLYDAQLPSGSIYLCNDSNGILLSGKTEIAELKLAPGVKASLYELAEGTNVGVIASDAFTYENAMAADYLAAGYFHTIVDRTSIREESGVLYMDVEKVYCQHCDQEVVWTMWTGISSPVSGHYYLTDDYSAQTKQLSIAADTDVVLDLQGKTYSTTGIRNFLVRGTLSVVDTVGGGEMVASGDPTCHGAIAMVSTVSGSVNPATFNLYSGTLRLADEHAAITRGGILQITNDATLNVYGGTIVGGETTEYGGNISIGSTSAAFNMYGGQILGGKAPAGGDIYLIGSFNMEGGEINGQVYASSDCPTLTLSNDVKIGELSLAEGKVAEVSGLSEGAQIGLTANGVFTDYLSDPEAYKQYFRPTNRLQLMVVDGNALKVYAEFAAEKIFNGVHTAAEKMTADSIFAAGGEILATCPYCGLDVLWNEFEPAAGKKITESGHYYLTKDYAITSHFTVADGADVCLHLNGNNITSEARAIHVAGHLNLMGEGNLTGAAVKHATLGWWGTLDVIGTVNLFGGTVTCTNEGSAITGRGNTPNCCITIYDGAHIERNASKPGLGIRLFDDADLAMFGGKISGGTNNIIMNGGSTANRSVDVSIYGGTIENGTASVGGNIYAEGASSKITIYGGTLTGGSVYLTTETKGITLSRKPDVSALDLTAGVLANISDLENEARIGILANGAFTYANEKAEEYLNAGCFYSANSKYSIYHQDNVLYAQLEKGYCEHCDQMVEWKIWPGATSPVSGHYFIDGDYTSQAAQISITDNTDVVLDLNGYDYITNNIRNFLVRGKLSIMDTVGGGEMITTGNAECAGGIALVLAPKDASAAAPEFNVYSGTLRLAESHVAFNNGGILQAHTGTVNIYGGTISGGQTAVGGGNLSLDKNVVFNMYGGEILGGEAPEGGSINLHGTMNMIGGIVDGEIYLHTEAKMTISNAAKVGNLHISEGVLVDVNGLTGGAEIGVQASGVFTTALTNAESYLAYFKTVNAGDTLEVVGNAISVKGVSEPEPDEPSTDGPNDIHTKAEKMTDDGVFAAGGVITALCPVCGTEEQWTDLATVSTPAKIDADGHFYLSSDLNVTKYFGFYADACLHLNGHNIASSERAIYVDAYYDKTAKEYVINTLNIMGEGTVSGAGVDHATIPRGPVDVGGSVNFYGGEFVATGDKNPAVTARGFNGHSVIGIYDGATFTAPGISLLARSNGIDMFGGAVLAGDVKVDGASVCSFNLNGGTLAGGIVAAGNSGILNINGGSVAGVVKVESTLKTVSVSGAPVISNLDLTSGKHLTVGELKAGASIQVSANGAFTDTLTNANGVLPYFAATEEGYEVVAESNVLVIRESVAGKGNKVHTLAEKMTEDGIFSAGGEVTAQCPVCESTVTWKDLNAVIAAQGSNKITEKGHFYLSADMELTSHLSTYVGMCLHLNGHNITSQARALYVEYCDVNIMGQGNVTGAGIGYNRGVIDAAGSVNLYGGTYTATNEHPVIAGRSNQEYSISMYEGATIVRDASNPGVNVWLYDHQDFNMYGGLVSGGSNSGANGGNFVLVSSAATTRSVVLNVFGGVIENGTAQLGGNIYLDGATTSLNVSGGTIRNGDVYVGSNAKGVTVSGSSVITELDLTSGKLLGLGVLKANADIAVRANGAFTEIISNAAAYKAYFKAADSGKTVTVSGDALAVVSE